MSAVTNKLTEAEKERIQIALEIDERNREEGKSFDPTINIFPADLFILKGFKDRCEPKWERNPRYHDENGYYIGWRPSTTTETEIQ
jgi:hypothetical protein